MSDAPHLNPPQREAVEHGEGALLILAGAGSGKTRVIVQRIVRLMQRGVRPWRILAVTFTNKAAGEMRERAAHLVDEEDARRLWIGTFHATCARLLRQHAEAAGLRPGFLIFDEDDQKKLVTRVMRDREISDRLATPRSILHEISRAKNHGLRPHEYRGGDFFTDLVAAVYPEYQRRLRDAGGVDFDDLLLETLHLCHDPEVGRLLAERFDHVLVDEFQDTNQVQYQLVRHLTSQSRNLCVVGDDDQSIYRWRGADLRNILDFEADHAGCRTIKLEQNYRSTQTILDAANGVIARNTRRKEKRLFTENGPGEPILYHTAEDERREAAFVVQAIRTLESTESRAPADIAIFYRTHAQSRAIEDALRAADMPYTVVGGIRFYDRAEVKDLLAYLRVLANPDDEVSLERIVNVPTRGIGETTLDKVRQLGRDRGVSLWEAMGVAAASEGFLGTGPRKKLREFVVLMEELREHARHDDLATLAERALDRSGYLEKLKHEGPEESRDRVENLAQLVVSMREYLREAEEPSLVGYLERVSLASSADTKSRGVALMTVHAAKGLEFPVVFITGLEEGTFPRVERGAPREEMEEERRLGYVAITRARERLFLTNSMRRQRFGEPGPIADTPVLRPGDPTSQRESRFIGDIPAQLIARPRPVRSAATSTGRPGGERWGEDRRVERRGPVGRMDADEAGGWRRERAPVIEDRGDGVTLVREPEAGSDAGPGGFRRLPRQRDERPESIALEYDAGAQAPLLADDGLRCGQMVRHSQWGVGKVLALSGSGSQRKATVHFPAAAATKTIMTRFLEPA